MPIEVTPETYEQVRRELVEDNANLTSIALSSQEAQVDALLERLKAEFAQACAGEVPYEMPVLDDARIWTSGLYAFCKALPKGADLHVHGTSLLPAWKLVDFVAGRDDVLVNIDDLRLVLPHDENVSQRCLPLGRALAEGLVSRAQLERAWTLRGAGEGDAWEYFENIFAFHEAIDRSPSLLRAYYARVFEDYLRCNVFHLEIHLLMSPSWEETEAAVRAIRDAYYQVRHADGRLRVAVIGACMKLPGYSIDYAEKTFGTALYLHDAIMDDFDPDHVHRFVVGFDLINEEDASRPLREYAPMLLQQRGRQPSFKFYLHCGESLDAESDNLIDAYLLQVDRVGHGLNLYRYPDLLRRYVQDQICLEVCPLSNQTLGYVDDLRLHPAAEYLKRGVTLALCSDDPAYQEHEQLTDDFFAAIACWDLGLAEVKRLCINSIAYAGTDERTRAELLGYWLDAWKRFLDEMLAREGSRQAV